MRKKTKTFTKRAAVIIFIAACIFCFYLPFPSKLADGETYRCVWADGSVTEESYTSAYLSLAGTDGKNVILSRGGLTGKIESRAEETYDVLSNGNLAQLLGCTAEGTRIDGAALFREFANRVWYSGSYFVWTGNKVERVSRAECEEIVFLEGSVTSRVLRETNASTVYLRAGAELSASAFAGSNVREVYAEAPYEQNGGAVYLNTPGGKRLSSAIGNVKELVLDGDLAFADEGALLACGSLTALVLPFLGSAKSHFGTEYRGEFAHLFSDGKEYRVPETLTYVEVTGGRIVSFAFYGCPGIKEINACFVSADEISRTAFSGLGSLEILHTPRRDVSLTGNFTSYTADCGCTVYTRN